MKSIRNIRISFSALCIFLLSACDMEQVIEVDLPQAESYLVVESYMENGEPYELLLSRTGSFTDPESLQLESGAEVQIHDGRNWHRLRETLIVDTTYRRISNYADTNLLAQARPGDEFRLQIKAGEQLIEGKARFMPVVPIKSVEIRTHSRDTLIALVTEIADPPNEVNYYRYTVHGANVNTAPTFDQIFTDETARDGSLRLATDFTVNDADYTLTVTVYHLEPAYYEFLKSLEMARMANYNPFQEPTSIKSTVQGGLGVFAALSYSREQVELTKLRRSGK